MSNPTMTTQQKLDARIKALPKRALVQLWVMTDDSGEVIAFGVEKESRAEDIRVDKKLQSLIIE